MCKKNILNISSFILACVILFSACRKKDAMLPDNLVNFESAAQGIAASENTITLKVKLERGTDRDIPVSINLTDQGVVYGTDYTTVPAATGGKISLTIPSGNNETSFSITKIPGALFDGDEKIVSDLFSSGAPVFIGAVKQFTLTFGELVATTATLTVNGGGATFPNKVFIDLSANRQTPVLRTAWDLGFYSGSDDYRVILNSSTAMMAKQLNKTDITLVNASDTLGFSTDVVFNQSAPTVSSLPYIDYPDGSLSKTTIASISPTAEENKVYIINRGFGVGVPAPSRGWKKIRIIRNASGGYTLQHADISASTFTTVDVPKNDTHFFNYVSFETGSTTVEPQKKKWDLAWTYFSNVTNFGSGEVPYLFQDIIIINRNVQVARVMASTKAYTDFTESDIAGQTFITNQNAIAADWRSGGGPTSGPAIRTDRYYIVRDGDNNYYKLRFTSLTQNGERGYPSYETALIQKG